MLSQNTIINRKINTERTKRSSNFSSKEIKFLLQMVDTKKNIIESKNTDRITYEEKMKAWMEIEEEFNAVFDEYRSFKVLKTKYENLKATGKRRLPTNVSNLGLLKIMQSNDYSVANESFDFKKENAFELDTKLRSSLNKQEIDAAAEEYVFETLSFGDDQTSSSTIQNGIPKQSQQLNPQPQSKIENYTEDIWEQVAYKKIQKLDLEIKVLEEEWKLKKLKLELEVENVRTENRLNEEKLKLELEILKSKLQNKISS